MRAREPTRRRGLLARAARRTRQILIAVVALVVILVALDVLVDEPLRRSIEERANQRLQGYT
jgi:hypothetical protein